MRPIELRDSPKETSIETRYYERITLIIQCTFWTSSTGTKPPQSGEHPSPFVSGRSNSILTNVPRSPSITPMYRTVPKEPAYLAPVHVTRCPSCTLESNILDDGIVLPASAGFLTSYYYILTDQQRHCSLQCFLTYVLSESMRDERDSIYMYMYTA